MPMYNLIEYSNNYSKTSESLWQYWKEIPAINNEGAIINFDGANATDSFNFKTKITGQTKNDEIINFELILNWSGNCVIIYTDVNIKVSTFAITDKSLCSCSYFIKPR